MYPAHNLLLLLPKINQKPHSYLAEKTTCLKPKRQIFRRKKLQGGTFQGNLCLEETRLNDVCGRIDSTIFGGQGDDEEEDVHDDVLDDSS